MIEIKKSDLTNLLLTIASYDKEGKMVGGLLMEKVSLGLKRKLQKIHTEAAAYYPQYEKDLEEAERKDEEFENLNPEGIKNKEVDEFLGETIKLISEKASLALIDGITSGNVYDDKLIEKIAE